MKYQLTIIDKTKDGNGKWQLEELAIERYDSWEEVLREIHILIPKGYLYELKIIEAGA